MSRAKLEEHPMLDVAASLAHLEDEGSDPPVSFGVSATAISRGAETEGGVADAAPQWGRWDWIREAML